MIRAMPRRVLIAGLCLGLSSLARAQILDPDLELEDHACVIELDRDSPILEGVGLSREIGYEVAFEGRLFPSVTAGAGVDPFLQLETEEGELVARDDDSGGGMHACLNRVVAGGERFVIRVAIKERAPA